MKQTCKRTCLILLTLILSVSLAACGEKTVENLWANATYREDADFGQGAKTVAVQVIAGEQSVTFTLHTDKETVGEALQEHNLIEGEQGAYGLYVKVVNGITADYEKTQSFWSFCRNGEAMTVGVDGEKCTDGSHYELVYTK